MGGKGSKAAKTVAVCGATGQQGGAVVDALLGLNKAFTIRALTRDPTKAAAKPGVTYVKADFDDPASLRAAFEGCDAAFAVTDFWKGCGLDPVKELTQAKNLVDAAKATGVAHFVFSTLEDTRPALGGSLPAVNGDYVVPHFDAKGEATLYMQEQLQGMWTAVLTSVFYENALPGKDMFPQKQEDGSYSLFIPGGGLPLAWCSTEDIGHVAAAIIAAGPKKFAGKTVPVIGAAATVGEFAAAMSKVSGAKVVPVELPPADYTGALVSFGVPELVAKDLGNMFAYYLHNGGKDVMALRPLKGTKDVYPQVMDVEAWVEKHKEAFAAALK